MVDLNILTANAPELTNLIGKFIYIMYNAIGNFGWTVVVFTIILKVILSPLDFWQKHVTRKNNNSVRIPGLYNKSKWLCIKRKVIQCGAVACLLL